MGRCRHQEAESRLFSYIFAIRSLSRAKTLASLSILCPFDAAELRTPLSKDLLAELEWQAQKAKETEGLYM